MIKKFNEFIIEEGLISSYPANTVVIYIQKKYDLKSKVIDKKVVNGTEIIIADKDIEGGYCDMDTYDEIVHILDICGYYYAYSRNGKIIFEKKFEKDVFDDLKKSDKIKYLYHVSPSVNDKKILSVGLIPKSSNYEFKYPDRIYFVTDEYLKKKNGLQNLCEVLYFAESLKKDIPYDTYSIYRILLDNLDGIKLYADPNGSNYDSFFTSDNIKPQIIEKVDEIKIDIEPYILDIYRRENNKS